MRRFGPMLAFGLLLVPIATFGSCTAVAPYTCANNLQCVRDGQIGICEATGHCSFADPHCTGSSRRYAEGATESLANQCVPSSSGCLLSVSAGEEHTCAIKADHTAWCWGSNEFGELGIGTRSDEPTPTPTAVKMPAGVGFTQIALGAEHTCALSSDGGVWCWGTNADGQLGLVDATGAKLEEVFVPTRLTGLPKVTSIAVGGKHTCAIDTDAHAWCWGEGGAGQIGDGGRENRVTPQKVTLDGVSQLGVGDEHTCAKAGSAIWCWGSNAAGQLGDAKLPPGESSSPVPVQLPSLLSVELLVSGDEHACAVKGNHTIVCWGINENGNVGMGAESTTAPITSVLDNVTDVWAGGAAFHTCAATNRDVGNLYCWGLNDFGQTGTDVHDASVTKPSPAHLLSVSFVAVGKAHSCATTRDGAFWCWGDNSKGQLGTGKAGLAVRVPTRVSICR